MRGQRIFGKHLAIQLRQRIDEAVGRIAGVRTQPRFGEEDHAGQDRGEGFPPADPKRIVEAVVAKMMLAEISQRVAREFIRAALREIRGLAAEKARERGTIADRRRYEILNDASQHSLVPASTLLRNNP